MDERSVKLYGTAQPVPETVALHAGPLTATLDAGQLRWIRLGETEIVRGIGFLVRDRNWSTAVPEIANLDVRQDESGFRVRFDAACPTIDGTLSWHAEIEGRPDGSLRFSGSARPESDFLTCRTGFVILHPLDGVVGRPVEIEHTDGTVERTAAPELIDPAQSFLLVRAMTTEPLPGLRATLRMEGDIAWETEDHRNWTDASFKTYVRPLGLPWPYTISAGTEIRQEVTLTVAGPLPASPAAAPGPVTVSLGGGTGRPMPAMGLSVLPEHAQAALGAADLLKRAGPQVVNGRVDLSAGDGRAEMAAFRDLASRLGAELVLELILPAEDAPAAELARVADEARQAGVTPDAIVVTPKPDLKSYPPGVPFPKLPPLADYYDAARAAFPGVRLGGGMVSFFPELNRKRPPADRLDFVCHGTAATIHAADDRSVMETLEAIPHITRSTRAIVGDGPYRVGPAAIGMAFNPYGATTTPNPGNGRVTMARMDPRQRGLFGAAWTLGYVAQVAPAGVEAVVPAGAAGEFGIVSATADHPRPGYDDRRDAAVYPVFHVVAGLARGAGAERVEASSSDPGRVLAVAWRDGEDDGGTTLWLANLRETPQSVTVEGAPGGGRVWCLDEQGFDRAAAGSGPDEDERPAEAGPIRLDAFAVARIRFGRSP